MKITMKMSLCAAAVMLRRTTTVAYSCSSSMMKSVRPATAAASAFSTSSLPSVTVPFVTNTRNNNLNKTPSQKWSSNLRMTATDASIAVAKRMKTVDITEASEEPIVVKGWVRTVRKQKTLAFVEVNDGSSLAGIQCVLGFDSVDDSTIEEINNLTTGSSVEIHGTAIASQGGKQSVEISASSMRIVGECPPDTYPLAKKRHSLEYLRTIAHLRPRTNTLAAVARVRSTLAQEIHAFFASQGFVFVHTPLITASDCEGAGEMFRVTTLDLDDVGSLPTLGGGESAAVVVEEKEEVNVEELEGKIASKGGEIRDLKAEGISKADLKPHIDELLALKAQLPSEEDGDDSKTQTTASSTSEGVDYAEDFFGKPAFLTVSGQLGGETHACALGDVYTFGPTFRAENSQTTRHLAEFHMVEPEMAFADLTSAMDNAESMLKQVVGNVLEKCMADVTFFNNFYEKGLIQRLTKLVDTPFVRISYREAVECLKEEIEKDPSKWQFPDVEFGTDLATEHERWLAETKFESAVFVYNYPKSIKAFYMRDNDEDGGETVNAMDLLVPGVGELVGGSQREERLDVLEQKISELGLDKEDYWWYLDLRRFGSVPHSGYGLGFERLVCYVCGIENIRDAIAFPRYPGNAEF